VLRECLHRLELDECGTPKLDVERVRWRKAACGCPLESAVSGVEQKVRARVTDGRERDGRRRLCPTMLRDIESEGTRYFFLRVVLFAGRDIADWAVPEA
jgi:hypothetical protein